MSSVTASAPRTTTASPMAVRRAPVRERRGRAPRSAARRSSDGRRRSCRVPSPLTPRITRSPSAVASTVARCGVCIRASNEIRPGTAGGQPHDDHLVGRAGEHLAGERDAAAGVGHVRRGRRQVEIAAVVLDRVDLLETSARDRRPSGTASARAASPSPSRRRASRPPGTRPRRADAGPRAARPSRPD